jgi:nitrogen PTS system EIIA component
MRLCNFIIRDAIVPALSASGKDVNPRDPAAVAKVKESVIREMVQSLHAAVDRLVGTLAL